MASPSSSDPIQEMTLPECFDLAFRLHLELETTDQSTSSDKIQVKIRNGIIAVEKAISMVNELQIFSINEDIEEVSTNEIKYMLLSCYLAYLTNLNTHLPRVEVVKKSQICYKDFLRLISSYSVVNVRVEEDNDSDTEDKTTEFKTQQKRAAPDLAAMSSQRNSKIQRFKEKKALEQRLAELKTEVEKEHVDDEIKRDFYLTQIKHWATLAEDEMENSKMELEILAHRDHLKKTGKSNGEEHSQNVTKKKPFRPFILTKNQLQKQVFGLGYPAVPTMTVDEFYEEKLKEGTLSESVQGHSLQDWAKNPEKDAEDREKEQAEKEEKVERDNPDELARQRAWDDWKDENRRGDGNRYNKG